MNIKTYKLTNCWQENFILSLDLDQVKYIFKQVKSSDDVFVVVYKSNVVKTYDSDTHFRHIDFDEGFEMIYPEQIDLTSETIEPNTTLKFISEDKLCPEKNTH